MMAFLRRLFPGRPGRQGRPPEEEEWPLGRRHLGGSARWFAFSTAAHVVALSVLATLTATTIQKRQSLIKVTALPLPQEVAAESPEEEEWEGEPSLRDVPGILSLDVAPATKAQPPPRGGPRVEAVRVPALPVLSGVGPTMPLGSRLEGLSTQITSLSGAIGGIGGGFGDFVGGLRKVGLDVVLVIDTTDSMQFVIDTVKGQLDKLVASLRAMVPTSRIGIVAYRDRGDEYITKWADLSFSTAKIRAFLGGLAAGGGGDWPESVYDGLDVAVRDLSWRKRSKRIIILAAGSPPHVETIAQIQSLVGAFYGQGGFLSVVDLADKMHEDFERALWRTSLANRHRTFAATPLPSFYRDMRDTLAAVARAGGGEFVPLAEEKALIRQILALTFGTRWKVEMAKYLRDLE